MSPERVVPPLIKHDTAGIIGALCWVMQTPGEEMDDPPFYRGVPVLGTARQHYFGKGRGHAESLRSGQASPA